MFNRKALSAVVAAAVCAFAFSGCGFDLSLPERPQRGALNGSLDTGGHLPLGNHIITLVPEEGSKQGQVTNADGTFAFSDLVPGVYYVDVTLPGFAPLIVPSVRVKAGQTLELGALQPTWLGDKANAGTLTGKVVAGGGASAEGAELEFAIEPVNTTVARGFAASDGKFTQALAPGSYTITAKHPLFVTGKISGVKIAQSENKDISGSPITLDLNPAKIVGTVFRERDGQAPIAAANAQVTLEDGSSTNTDQNGAFELSNLAAVNRTLRVSLAGFHDPKTSYPVALKPGQTTTLPQIILSLDRGAIIGKVAMGDGKPVGDVNISITGTPYSAAVSPDTANPSTGTFKISAVPVGDYEVSASRPGYTRAVATSVAVTANGSTDVGTLTLTFMQGDVQIDDADTANTAGYSRTAAVTLKLNNFVSPAAYRASEDESFANVAFAPYTGSSQPFTLSTAQGLHTVYVQYKDAAGSTSNTFAGTVVLDTVAPASPAVQISGGAAFTRSATTFNLVLTADDATSGLSGMRVGEAVDGQGNVTASRVAYQRDFAYSRTANGDGSKTVRAQFIDHAGNVSAAASAAVVVDTANPSGAIAIARGSAATEDGFTNEQLIYLTQTAAAEPNGGSVSIKMADSVAQLAGAVYGPLSTTPVSRPIDISAEGTKTVFAQLMDSAGNTSPVFNASIVYDKTGPSPVTLTLSGPVDINTDTVQLGVTAADARSGLSPTQALTLSQEGGATVGPEAFPTSSTKSFTVSTSAQGEKVITARFKDRAGNTSTASVTVNYDTLAPSGSLAITGTLVDGSSSTTLTATPNVTLNLTHSGANRYLVAAATDTACPATGYLPITGTNISHTLSGAGLRSVRMCLLDAAGNSSGFLSASITLDSAAPQSCALSLAGARPDGRAAPAGLTATNNVTATVSGCNETPSSLFITTSAVTCSNTAVLAWTPYTPSQAVSLSTADGVKTVRGCVKDAAGNVSAIANGAITLDTVPPSPATASILGATITSAGTVTVALNAADTNGMEAAEAVTLSEDVFFNGATTVGPVAMPSPAQLSFPLSSSDGEKTIYVRFRDAAGNDAFTQVKVTRDTSPPTGAIALRGTLADGTASATLSSSASVAIELNHSGAVEYVKGAGSITSCPATGWAAIPTGTIPHTLTVANGATETVKVCVRDVAGNTAGPFAASITFDTSGPAGCAVSLSGTKRDGSAAPAGFTAASQITAAVAGCDAAPADIVLVVGTVTCSATAVLDWRPFNATNNVNLGTTEGSRTVTGCVRDAARNVSTLAARTLTLDTTPPSSINVSVVGGATTTNNPAITLGVSALEVNGLESVTVSESALFSAAGTVGPMAMPANNQVGYTLSSADGDKQLYVRLRDIVGNEGFADRTVTLDRTAPSGSHVITGTLADGTKSTTLTSTPNVLVDITQTGSSGYLLGNEALTACPTTAASYSSIPAGSISHTLSGTANPRQVRMCLRDAAGNLTGPLTQTITLDGAAPSNCALTLSGSKPDGRAAPSGLTASSAVLATVLGCDETPASLYVTTDAVTCTSGTFTWTPYTASQTVSLPSGGDGLKTVRGCVRDAAGNISSITPGTITRDTAAPNPATVTLSGGATTSATSVTLVLNAADTNGLDSAEAVTASEDVYFSGPTTVGPQAMPSGSQLTFPLSSAEGEKTIFVRFRDAVGNDAFAQVKVTLDTQAPTATFQIRGTLADGTTSTLFTNTAAVSLEIAHNGASEYVIGAASITACPATGWQTLSSTSVPHTLSVSSGLETVKLCLRDSAQNTLGPIAASITRDASAPTGCALALAGTKRDGSAAPSGYTASADVQGTLSACNDTPSEIYLTQGSVTCSATAAVGWVPFSATKTLSVAGADGARPVAGCVRDAARNVAAITGATITLDTTAPSALAVSVVGGATVTNNPAVTLSITATEANGLESVTVSENSLFNAAGTAGPMAMPANNQVSYTLSSADGEKRMYVRLRDLVGNETIGDSTVTLDRTTPTGSLTLTGTLVDGTTSSTLTATPSVTVEINQNGATGYLLGNESTVACPTAASSYTPIATGAFGHTLTGAANPRVVRMCLRDDAGNIGGPVAATITLDETPPLDCAISLAGAKPDGREAPSGLTASSGVTATISGCRETPTNLYVTTGAVNCTTDTLAWTPYTASQTVALSSGDGPKTVRGCVRDAAGNITSVTAGTITRDTTPPSPATVTVSQGAVTSATTVTLVLNASDSNSLDPAEAVTASEDVYFNGATTVGPMAMPAGSQLSFPLSAAEGEKTVYVRFRDAVGNDAFAQVKVTLDTQTPTASFVIRGTLADGSSSTTLTNTASVTLDVTHSGATEYVRGNAAMTACPAAGWQQLTSTSIPYTLTVASGMETVKLCLRDGAQNTVGPISASITRDGSAPTGCSLALGGVKKDGTAAPSGFTADPNVGATITGCSELPTEIFLTQGSVTCSATAVLDWKAFASTSTVNIGNVEGSRPVAGCVRDAARNVASIAGTSITLDKTAPSNVVAVLSGPSVTAVRDVTLTVTASEANALDAAAGVTVSENAFFTAAGTAGPMAMPGNNQVSYQLSAGDGTKQLYVRVRDLVGNDGVGDVSVTLDQTAPTGAVVLTGTLVDGTTSNTLTATPNISVAITQSGATRYLLGNESVGSSCPTTAASYTTLTTNTLSHTLSGTAQPRQVRMCLMDAAGNVSTPAVATIALDEAPPAGCLVSLTGSRPDGRAASAGVTATTNVSATVGSCSETPTSLYLTTGSVTCSPTETIAWAPFTATQTLSLSGADGSKTLRGCVKDAAGNVAGITAGSITLDTTPPSPATASISGASVTSANSVTVLFSAADTNGLDANEALTISEDVFFNGSTTVGPQAMPGGSQLSFPLSTTEGEKILYVRFRDAAGNEAFTQVKVTRDTVAPTLAVQIRGTLADGTTSTTLSAVTGVNVELTHTGASEYLLTDGTPTTCPSSGYTQLSSNMLPLTLTVANGDSQTVKVCVRDAAGNTTGPIAASITRDGVAPGGCLLALQGKKKDGSAAPTGYTANPEVTANVSACNEAPADIVLVVGTVTCSATAALDWKAYNSASTVNLGTAETVRTVSGCVRDAAHNVSPLTPDSIELDTTAPATITATLVGPSVTNSTSVTLSLSAVEANALDPADAVTISENAFFTAAGTVGPVAMPGNNQVAYTLSSADGPKQLYVRLRDLVGNEGFGDTSVTLDRTRPTGSFTIVGTVVSGASSSDLTSTPSVTLQLTHTGATGYLLGNETLTSCPSTGYTDITTLSISHTLTGTANPRQVRMCLRDESGNLVENPLADDIVLDSAAPAGCAFALQGSRPDGLAAPAGLTATNSITASVTGCDEIPVDMYVTTDPVTCSSTASLSWAPFTAVRTVTLPSGNDEKTVRGCVRDRAGNVSAISSANITLDTVPPSPVSLTAIPSPVTRDSFIVLQLNASDSNGLEASQAVTLSEDLFFNGSTTWGPAAMPGSAQVPFNLSASEGDKTVYARFRDAAGNDAFTSIVITRDTTAPAGSFFITGTRADTSSSTSITSTASVNLTITQTGATHYVLAGTCPAVADGSWQTVPSTTIPHTLTGGQGMNTLQMCFKDAAGNVTGPVSASIFLDSDAPSGCGLALSGTTTTGVAAPFGYTANPIITAGLSTCADAVDVYLTSGSVTCSATAVLPWETWSGSTTLELLGNDGLKTVNGCVRDSARNVATITSSQIRLDTTAPSNVVAAIVGGRYTKNQAVTVHVTATEANPLHASEAVTISENAFFTAAGTVGPMAMPNDNDVSYTLSSGENDKTLSVRVRDGVGNEGFGSVVATYDITAPSGAFTISGNLADGTPSADITANPAVRLNLTHEGAFAFHIGNESLAACPTALADYTPIISPQINHTLTGSAQPRVVKLCLIDRAGNVGDMLTGSITLDESMPANCQVSITGYKQNANQPAPTGYSAQRNVQASIKNCSETPADIFFVEQSSAPNCTSAILWTGYSNSVGLTLTEEPGTKRVWGCVRDSARRVAAAAPFDVVLDVMPPMVMVNPGWSYVNDAGVTYSVTADDGDAGAGLDQAEALTVSEDYFFQTGTVLGPTAFPDGGVVDFPLTTTEGYKSVYFRVRDAVGNDGFGYAGHQLDTVVPTGTVTIYGFLRTGALSTEYATGFNAVGGVPRGRVRISADAQFYSIGTEAMTDCTDPTLVWTSFWGFADVLTTLTSTATPLEVRVCLKDLAGNISATPISDTINLDMDAPTGCTMTVSGTRLDGQAAPAGYTRFAEVTALVDGCSETPSHMYIREGAVNCNQSNLQWTPYVPQQRITLTPGDGAKTVNGCVKDVAGNVSALGASVMTVDTMGPNAAANVAGFLINTNTVSVTVNGSDSSGMDATEALRIFDYSGSTQVGPMAMPASLPATVSFTLSNQEGYRYFYAVFKDIVGNESWYFMQVQLDTQPPSGQISIEGKLADGTTSFDYTTSTTVDILGVPSDAVDFALGDETLTDCTTAAYLPINATSFRNKTLTSPSNPAKVHLCLRDAAQNLTTTPLEAQIIVKTTQPSNCAVQLTGTKVDGSAAPGGFTAHASVSARITGCSEDPTEVYLVNGSVTCSTNASFDWVPYSEDAMGNPSPQPFLLTGADGVKPVNGCVRDAVRHVVPITFGQITLDTRPPEAIGILVDNGNTYLNREQAIANGAATDGGINQFDADGGIVAIVKGLSPEATEWTVFLNATSGSTYQPYSPGDEAKVSLAGEGESTVFARYRDALGNETTVVYDDIIVDTLAPAAGSFQVYDDIPRYHPGPNEVYTNQTSLVLTPVSHPIDGNGDLDAASIQIGEDVSWTNCSVGAFTNPTQPLNWFYTFNILAIDAMHQVCVRWFDAAGNPSPAAPLWTVRLERVAPDLPQLLTQRRTFNPTTDPDGSNQKVLVSDLPATDHQRWEITSTYLGSWTEVTPTDLGSNLQFLYALRVDATAAAGLPNILQVREVDLYGNASPAASVTVIPDVVVPGAVQLNSNWVVNENGQAAVYWKPSTSPDVIGYDVYYGSNAGDPAPLAGPTGYLGSFAAQGTSPIRFGLVENAKLSGLPNGASTYVTVRAVDHAGNLSPQPSTSTKEVTLQPNVVSPNLVQQIGANVYFTHVNKIEMRDNWAYVAGRWNCNEWAILAVNMATVRSPLESGKIANPAPPLPSVGSWLRYTFGGTCGANEENDLLIDGHYLFVAGGDDNIRIYSLDVPSSPSLVTTLSPAIGRVAGLAARGNVLFAQGASGLIAYNISSLYDGTTGTSITSLGTSLTTPAAPGGLTITRNKLIVGNGNPASTSTYVYDITPQLAAAPGAFSSAQFQTSGAVDYRRARFVTSGNILVSTDSQYNATSTFDLQNIWASAGSFGAATNTASYGGNGQYDLVGRFLTLAGQLTGIRLVDASTLSSMTNVGLYNTTAQMGGIANYGNYMLSGMGGTISFFEIATPTGLNSISAVANSSPSIDVGAGLVYNAGGNVHDLLAGTLPKPLATSTSGSCTYSLARFDEETTVSPIGQYVWYHDLRNLMDRNASTAWSNFTDDTLSYTGGPALRVTGAASTGNYLVLAESRDATAPGGAGVYLRVVDARSLRDTSAATVPSLTTNLVGEVKVSASWDSQQWVDVRLANGIASVSISSANSGITYNPSVFFVDIRDVIDDATGGSMILQGSVNIANARQTVIQGNQAYVVNDSGLYIVDATNAVDNSSATLPPTTWTSFTSVPFAGSVEAFGSYAFVMPYKAVGVTGVSAFDVSTPATPRNTGYLQVSQRAITCFPVGEAFQIETRGQIRVRGARAYLGTYDRLEEIGLE